MNSLRERRAARIREMAEAGKTRAQVAQELLMSYGGVVTYAREFGIAFVHASKDRTDGGERADTMSAMFKSGKTLQEIGSLYGLTRERVRQIITKHKGLVGQDGGASAKARMRTANTRAKKEADCLKRCGCTLEQLHELRAMGRRIVANGGGREKTPIGAFSHQRCAARRRGIEWNLTLWQWWTIWAESGKWYERGRHGDGYVMCRFRDDGPYEIANAYIATLRHNSTVQPNNPYRRSHPDFAKAMAEKAARRLEARAA